MDKVIGSLLQGTPTALVVGIVFLLFVQPMNSRIENVVTIMNREVIPVINELKRQQLPGPEIKPMAEISRQLTQALAALETQEKRARAIEAAIEDVKKRQEVSVREVQRLALGVALAPQLAWDTTRTYKRGEFIPFGPSFESAVMHNKPLAGFVVTDPQPINQIKQKWVTTYKEFGLEPRILPPEKPKP